MSSTTKKYVRLGVAADMTSRVSWCLGHGHRPSNGRSSCDCFFIVVIFPRQNKMPLGVRWHCAVLLFGVVACASEVVQKTDLSRAQVPRMPQGVRPRKPGMREKYGRHVAGGNPRETRMAFVPTWVFRGCISQADPSCLVRRGHASVVSFCLWVSQRWLDQ